MSFNHLSSHKSSKNEAILKQIVKKADNNNNNSQDFNYEIDMPKLNGTNTLFNKNLICQTKDSIPTKSDFKLYNNAKYNRSSSFKERIEEPSLSLVSLSKCHQDIEFYNQNAQSQQQLDFKLKDIQSMNDLSTPKPPKSSTVSNFTQLKKKNTAKIEDKIYNEQTYSKYPLQEKTLNQIQNQNIEEQGSKIIKKYENPELNYILDMLESRFTNLEQRIETNESLIHLHEEMQIIKKHEKQHKLSKNENLIYELYKKMEDIESRIKYIEKNLRTSKIDIEFKLEESICKFEKNLSKFGETITNLALKVDKVLLIKEAENSTIIKHDIINTNKYDDKINYLENNIDKLAEEMRDKLKQLYSTIGNLNELIVESQNKINDHQDLFTYLEIDIYKLLNYYKRYSEDIQDYQWLSDEIKYLKYLQLQIINYIKIYQNINIDPSNIINYKNIE